MPRPMKTQMVLILGFAAFVFSVSVHPASAQSVQTKLLLLTGDPAPGLAEGVVFSGLSNATLTVPQIANTGRVAFLASVDGPRISSLNSRGLWSISPDGELSFVLRIGQPAPETEFGTTANWFSEFILGPSGQLSFLATLGSRATTTIGDAALYHSYDSGLSRVARIGKQMPLLPEGQTYSSLAAAKHSLASDAYTYRFRADQSTLQGLVYDDGMSRSIIAHAGITAPGMPQGTTFENVIVDHLGDEGEIVFDCSLAGPSISSANDRSLWRYEAGTLALLLQEGDELPSSGSFPVFFRSQSYLSLGFHGEALFTASITGDGVNLSNDQGVWLKSKSTPFVNIARTGEPAPGTEAGTEFSAFIAPVLDGKGRVVFWANVDGPGTSGQNRTGVWRGTNSTDLELVLRQNDQMPGMPPGVLFGIASSIKSNSLGQIAFSCSLSGPGTNQSNNDGLFITSIHDEMLNITRTGDSVDVSRPGNPPDLRVVEFVRLLSEYTIGSLPVLNDRGELVYVVRFTDGSQGLFLAWVESPCPADTNNDGILSPADFSAWIAAFNAGSPECDQNADGLCTPADFSAWIANFNAGC